MRSERGRIYNEKGMQLRNKTPKRRVKAALRAYRTPPLRSGAWAMDFVHDQLATASKLRISTGIDPSRATRRVGDRRLAIALRVWWQRCSVGKGVGNPAVYPRRPRQRIRLAVISTCGGIRTMPLDFWRRSGSAGHRINRRSLNAPAISD